MDTPNSYQEQFEALINFDGDPAEKLARRHQAIDLADQYQDDEGRFRARLDCMSLGLAAGQYDDNVFHFVQCVEICERRPELLFPYGQLMALHSRYNLASLACYAAISRRQIAHADKYTARLYETAGWGTRALHKTRMFLSTVLGDLDQIAVHRSHFLASPRQGGEDCLACEISGVCKAFIATHQLDLALTHARDLLNGKLTCGTQPAGTDADLILPLLRAGNLKLAQKIMRRSFNTVRDDIGCFDDTGRFIAYLVATDQLPRALQILESALANFPTVRRDWDRFWMLSGTCLLLRRLTQARPTPIHLRLPPHNPCYRANNRYDPATLLAWAAPQLQTLAQRFDARNGNLHYSNILRDLDTVLEHITPIPDTLHASKRTPKKPLPRGE
jgi:hypothetical protein